MKTTSHIIYHTKLSILSAVALITACALTFVLFEPHITHSQEFTITTSIGEENSFKVPPSDVIMVGTLNGVTGGQATGSTQFVVQSNSTGGYEVQIAFTDNGTANAMIGDTTANESIRDYGGDVGGEPSKGYTASGSAQFAYTVTSSTSADTDQSFFHDGTANCNDAGKTSQATTCWKSPAVGAFTIVDRNTEATSGATSTIIFNITVPGSVSPVPAADGYTATATLSLVNT